MAFYSGYLGDRDGPRSHRKRLIGNGYPQSVMKGWHAGVQPARRAGRVLGEVLQPSPIDARPTLASVGDASDVLRHLLRLDSEDALALVVEDAFVAESLWTPNSVRNRVSTALPDTSMATPTGKLDRRLSCWTRACKSPGYIWCSEENDQILLVSSCRNPLISREF
jgi:hypothetical protein